MSSTINASVDGIVLTASSTAAMNLATGGTNRLSIDTSGNVGIATGNLSFSATGQRITGDMSNATHANRLGFQTSTANAGTTISAFPNGTGGVSQLNLYANPDPTNASLAQFIVVDTADVRLNSNRLGTGTYLPITFYTGGSERMRLDTSGNLGIGMTPVYALDLTVGASNGIRLNASSGQCNMFFQQAGSTNGIINAAGGAGTDLNIYATRFLSLRGGTDGTTFFTNSAERMRIDSSGNVGIGTASPASKLDINTGASTGTSDLITLSGLDSGSAKQTYATIRMGIENNTAGAEQGNLHLQTVESGTVRDRIYLNGSGYMTFLNGGSERMRITSGGLVGIGTASPNVALEVASIASENSRSLRVAYDTTYYYEIRNLGAAGNRIRSNNGSMTFNITGTDYAVLTTGGEFITGGTTDQGAYNLQCNGTGVWGAGAYVNGSDERLKDNIQSLDAGLDVVKAMRPVTFQYKPEYSKDQSIQPGFIAQELQTAMAGKSYLEGVVQEGSNHLNVAYQNIIPILVKAIQELEAKVAALESK